LSFYVSAIYLSFALIQWAEICIPGYGDCGYSALVWLRLIADFAVLYKHDLPVPRAAPAAGGVVPNAVPATTSDLHEVDGWTYKEVTADDLKQLKDTLARGSITKSFKRGVVHTEFFSFDSQQFIDKDGNTCQYAGQRAHLYSEFADVGDPDQIYATGSKVVCRPALTIGVLCYVVVLHNRIAHGVAHALVCMPGARSPNLAKFDLVPIYNIGKSALASVKLDHPRSILRLPVFGPILDQAIPQLQQLLIKRFGNGDGGLGSLESTTVVPASRQNNQRASRSASRCAPAVRSNESFMEMRALERERSASTIRLSDLEVSSPIDIADDDAHELKRELESARAD
jgi:hypothetical protein